MKHKARLFTHGVIQIWGIKYWETYSPVGNWISVRSLLAIPSTHEFPSRSIDFVISFTQSDIYMDVLMDLSLLMVVDGNRVEWVIKLIGHIMD